MRVFAGPNGSGKSSIIKSVLNTSLKDGKKLDFGIYINADDIAVSLFKGGCILADYEVNIAKDDLLNMARQSGLLNNDFPFERFRKCLIIENGIVKVNKETAKKKNDFAHKRIAQIIADSLRKKLLTEGKKFSFETVFSHPGKVDIMKQAKNAGYKVYLYFVSTEHPEINVYRVKVVRVGKKGHDVDKDKIKNRYYRSMELMFEAAQNCYQAYFFDNSTNDSKHTMFAHFKIKPNGEKEWDNKEKAYYPLWFKKYYSTKVNQPTRTIP